MKNFTKTIKQPALLIILLVTTGFCYNVSAADRYAVNNGDWDKTSTWSSTFGGASGASVPVAGDIVYIGEGANNREVKIPNNYTAACAAIYLGSLSDSTHNKLKLEGNTSKLNVSGSITINRPAGLSNNLNELEITDGAVNVSGDVIFSGASTSDKRDIEIYIKDGSLSVSGDIVFNGGSDNNNTFEIKEEGYLYIGGNFSSQLCKFSADKATITYNKAGDQTILAMDYTNLILTGSGIKTLLAGTLKIENDLVIDAGATFNGITNNPKLELKGNFTNNGTFNQGTGDLTLDGDFTNSGIFSQGTGKLTINDDFTNGGTFNQGTKEFTLNGDFNNNGTYNEGTGELILKGKDKQTISSSSDLIFSKITIDNSENSAPQVVLATDISVTSTLELKKGIVFVNDKDIIIESGASISGGDDKSFIYTVGNTGGLKYKNCAANSSKFFPVGHTPTKIGYAPVTLTFNAGHTTDDYTVNVDSVITIVGADTGTEITKRVVKATWHVSEASAGGSNLNFRFQWDEKRTGSKLKEDKPLQLLHYTSGYWEKPTGKTAMVKTNGKTRYIDYTGYTGSFSPFGMEGDGGTLPVTWLKVNGTRHNNENIITWSTATEINNDFFRVESSVNGNDFKAVGIVKGAGNKATISNYSFIDRSNANATTYYRIAQTDFDGTTSYSDIIAVNQGNILKNSLSLYPNPVVDVVSINIAATQRTVGSIIITDLMGAVVYSASLDMQKGDNMNQVNISNYTKGMYFVQVTDANGISQSKRIIKN